MEPTKISSIKELDLVAAQKATKAIASLLDGLAFAAPEDVDGAVARLKTIASKITDIATALKITPPSQSAHDAPVVHDLQQRIQTLEGAARRHREQRGAILEALGGVTWDQAVPRARELVATVRAQEEDLAQITRELPSGDAEVGTALRVRQLVREHREMAEEMVKGADPVDVLEAALSTDAPARDSGVDNQAMPAFIDIVLDGPPGPNPGRFVEVEDPRGRSIHVGQWIDRGECWALRIPMSAVAQHNEPPVELEDVAIAGTISALAAVITTSALNWERYPCLAWIYGVLVGHGVDTLDELQQAFGWRDGTVEEIEGHRRVLLAARGTDVL